VGLITKVSFAIYFAGCLVLAIAAVVLFAKGETAAATISTGLVLLALLVVGLVIRDSRQRAGSRTASDPRDNWYNNAWSAWGQRHPFIAVLVIILLWAGVILLILL
jgi:hypothetical protein